MRFVPVKSEEQQSALMLHKARELLLRQQTMLINALRGHMAELGGIVPQGYFRFKDILAMIDDEGDETVPAVAKAALRPLTMHLRANREAAAALETEIRAWHKGNEESCRLGDDPGCRRHHGERDRGYGPRSFFLPIWPGIRSMARPGPAPALDRREGKARPNIEAGQSLHPNAPGGRCHQRAENPRGRTGTGIGMDRRVFSSVGPPRLVTVAMANKMARIVWAIMTKKATYQPQMPAEHA